MSGRIRSPRSHSPGSSQLALWSLMCSTYLLIFISIAIKYFLVILHGLVGIGDFPADDRVATSQRPFLGIWTGSDKWMTGRSVLCVSSDAVCVECGGGSRCVSSLWGLSPPPSVVLPTAATPTPLKCLCSSPQLSCIISEIVRRYTNYQEVLV